MANNVVSIGRIELIDMNDNKQLQLFMASNQPKTQIYNTDSKGLSPDWSTNKPVLTPQLFVAGTSTDIIANAKSVTWFEDGDSTAIGSGTEYTLGTGNKTLTINRNILLDNSLKFDGTNWIGFGNTNGSNVISFEQWIIPSTTSGYLSLFTKESSYKLRISGSSIQGMAGTSGSSWTTTTLQWNGDIKPYNLYHIVGIVDLVTGYMQVFVNGVDLGKQTFTGATSPTLSTKSINFGSYSDTTTGEMFKGKFLGGRIYNRALTATEVTNNYNGTITTSGLVAEYLLNDGAGNTVKDSKGTANGTINGTAKWNPRVKPISCEVIYTDPKTGFDIVSRAKIEFVKVETGTKGATGDAGANAIISQLNNEFETIYTDKDGNNGNFANAKSTMYIYNGATDDSSNWSVTANASGGITGSLSGKTYTVTNMTTDTGTVTFTATRSGYTTQTKTFTLSKVKVGSTGAIGATGSTAYAYWATSSAVAIQKNLSGVYTPSTVTFGGIVQAGTGTPTAYPCRFIISETTDGSNWTDKYTSNIDESSKAYTPSAGIKAVRVKMYLAGGTSTQVDEQVINIVSDANTGATGATGDNAIVPVAWTPNGNIIKNKEGYVTAQADLYNGSSTIVTGSNYRWYRQNPSKTSVVAGAGWEDLDLGKRNLMLKSGNYNNSFNCWTPNGGTMSIDTSVKYNGFNTVKTVGNNGITYYDWITLKPNTIYTYSVIAKADVAVSGGSGVPLHMWVSDTKAGGHLEIEVSSNMTIGTSWTFARRTFKTPNVASVYYMKPFIYGIGTSTVWVAVAKVEEGSVATPWALAPEDVPVGSNDNNMYGRNLMKNTYQMPNLNYWSLNKGSAITATLDLYNDPTYGNVVHSNLSVNATSGSNWWLIQGGGFTLPNGKFTIGQTYTVSFMIKNTIPLYFNFEDSNGLNPVITGNKSILVNSNWTKFIYTFTATATGNIPQFYLAKNDNTSTGDVYITQIKLEQGAFATDWTPAPEENLSSYPNLTAGINKWIFRYYPNGSVSTRKIYDYSDLKALNPTYQTLLADQADIQKNIGDYYIGYYKTAVYVSTAKTISFTLSFDDTLNVLVNGVQQYSNLTTSSGVTVTLNLQAGWNTVEFIEQEITLNDGIFATSILSSLVDEMNCHYALDYGALRGIEGISGYNTNFITISADSVIDIEYFQCYITYNGTTYKDAVVIHDISDPIYLNIIGTSVFKNGQGSNTYTAKLFQNGVETDANGSKYKYTWYMYKADNTLNSSFGTSGSKTGKTITVSSSEITNQGDLVCEIDVL